MFKVNKVLARVIMMCVLTCSSMQLVAADEAVDERYFIARCISLYREYAPYSTWAAAGIAGVGAVACYIERQAIGDTVAPLGSAACNLVSAGKHSVIGTVGILAATVKIGIKLASNVAAGIKCTTKFTADHPEFVMGTAIGLSIAYCWAKFNKWSNAQVKRSVIRTVQDANDVKRQMNTPVSADNGRPVVVIR